MYSLIIKNSTVLDGSGAKRFTADVAVESGKIVAVHRDLPAGYAKNYYDAKGMVLAPGFIDVQNHSDSYWQIFDNPTLDSIVTQGYTTILMGNSGVSLAPLISGESIRSIQKWAPTVGLNTNWKTFGEYRNQLSSKSYGTNLMSLIGYSTVRRGLLGDSIEPPTRGDLQAILNVIEQGLNEGAKGVSVGLGYSHELNISQVELVELAELCAKHDVVLAVALRDESETITDSISELSALAEQTGVRLKISNLKLRHHQNWKKLTEVLDILETVWHRGAKISFDSYPYNFTLQPLYTYLPMWSYEGGRKPMLERLKDEANRKKVLEALANHPAHIGELVIASTGNNLKVSGRKISEVAKAFNTTSEEAALHLIENGGSNTQVFDVCLDPKQVEIINNHALGFIATNGGGFNLDHGSNLVHPRSFGSSAKFLRTIIDDMSISLEEAISKLTSKPAKFLKLEKRGQIKTDFAADLVLFDPKTIHSDSSIANPYKYAKGIEAVWVNGQLTVQKGKPTGNLGGNFLS